jgi:Ferritin-like domain
MTADFGLDLERLDRDGALEEARAGLSRRGLLVGIGVGAGGALLLRGGVARAQTKADIDVLNYALVLEYLQSAFYTEAERSKAITGRAGEAATTVGAVERAHVKAFLDILGNRAVKRPTFDFQGVTEEPRAFLKTAVAFEDLAVAAYKGQAPRLETPQIITSALGIHTVEARHAAWMRHLYGVRPATSAFDEPRSRPEIDRIVRETGFVVSAAQTRSNRAPRYTG